jgi:hypothetical protein
MSALFPRFFPAAASQGQKPRQHEGETPLQHAPATRADPVELSLQLARIETTSVMSERRHALVTLSAMLSNHAELVAHIKPPQIQMLMAILRQFGAGDADFAIPTLEILSAVTNEGRMAPNVVNAAMDIDAFVRLVRMGGFWSKYHSMQILIRLHRVDPSLFSSKLLEIPNAVADLVAVLDDDSNGGALRDEGLLLFTELTGPHGNVEVNTILAFHGCFESLFHIMTQEGGAPSGSVIIRDCLTIVQNMVRRNKNVQKYFRDMGLAVRLADLLETPMALEGAGPMSPDPQVVAILAEAVETVKVFVDGADGNGEGTEARDSLAASGTVAALCRFCFVTLPLLQLGDHTVEVEALRTLARCVMGCKSAAHIVADQLPRRSGAESSVLSQALCMALTDAVAERQAAASLLIYNVVSTAGAGAAQQLVRALGPRPLNSAQCGQLLGPYLFGAKTPTNATHYIARHVLALCLSQSCEMTNEIVCVQWEDKDPSFGACVGKDLFFRAYVAHAINLLRHRRSTTPDVSAAIRPIIFAMNSSCGALLAMLNDPSQLTFFAEWAALCPDGVHVRFLCAAVAALATVKLHELGAAAVPADLLRKTDIAKSLPMEIFDGLFAQVTATAEWTTAPRGDALTELPRTLVYDGPLVTLLSDVRSALDKVRPSHTFVASPACQKLATVQAISRPLEFDPAPLEELRHQIAQLTLQLQSTEHELHTEQDRSAEYKRRALEARQQITTLEPVTASLNETVAVLEAKLRARSEDLVIFDDVRSRLTDPPNTSGKSHHETQHSGEQQDPVGHEETIRQGA